MGSAIQYPMSPGTLYNFLSKSDGIVSEFKEIFPTNYSASINKRYCRFAGCFGAYFSDYLEDSNFYFGYPFLPAWYAKVVEQFNKEFKNIQYEILAEKNVPLIYRKDSTGTLFDKSITPATKLDYLKLGETPDVVLKSALFTIHLSEDYNEYSKKYLQYAFHHYLRMLSYCERDYIRIEDPDPKIGEDLISFVLEINNKNRGYRSLSEDSVSKEKLLRIDEPKRANSGIEDMRGNSSSNRRQTAIINFASSSKEEREAERLEKRRQKIATHLKALKESLELQANVDQIRRINKSTPLMEGEYIIYSAPINRYNITNNRMVLGRVVKIYSPDYINIRVILHENENHEGETFDVESKHFSPLTLNAVQAILRGKDEERILDALVGTAEDVVEEEDDDDDED